MSLRCLLFCLLSCLLLTASIRPSHSLNVHLVPHTHDDVGWLITVDQYYIHYVQYILDTVITQLSVNPERKFVYVEQAFFQRWWREQSESRRNLTRQLVQAGQLEFINGGWAMHDEGCTHYVDMIDQTTLGHSFITDQFGTQANPTVGWQIDPFGHSATQAAILTAQAGFDGFFFARIDNEERAWRRQEQALEFVWRGSNSSGSRLQMLAGAFQVNSYEPPGGFCFDMRACDGGQPVQDDPALNDYNLDSKLQDFVRAAQQQAANTQGDNIMWTLGSDFQYTNAAEWFKNIDKLIAGLRAHPELNITAFYSTPSLYLRAKNAENISWPLKTDDFFPYGDGGHSQFSGYLTSRPALKGYVRQTSEFLQLSRQVVVAMGGDTSSIDTLEEAQGVVQHHDGVSGTSKQAVAFDYAQRLAKGVNVAEAFVDASLSALVSGSSSPGPKFSSCPMANVSLCAATASYSNLVLVIWNPLPQPSSELITIPVPSQSVNVSNASAAPVPSVVLPAFQSSAKDPSGHNWTVSFIADLPPLGFSTYFIQHSVAQQAPEARSRKRELLSAVTQRRQQPAAAPASAAAPSSIENEYWRLSFASNGSLQSVTDKQTEQVIPFSINLLYYRSSTGDGDRPSGAYVFRPNVSDPFPIADANSSTPITLSIVSSIAVIDPNNATNGNVTAEARLSFSPWAAVVLRLIAGQPEIEMEYVVGPVPIDDGWGKEVVVRYEVGIANNKVWWTDSNGRELQRRVRNERPGWNYVVVEPVASNFVPVNAFAYLADSQRSLAVLPDRSHGCGSIHDGQLEVMLHRRILHDDYYGEPLNETETLPDNSIRGLTITGKHRLQLSLAAITSLNARPLQSRIFFHPYVALAELTSTPADYVASHNTSMSFLASALPASVDLVTLRPWRDGSTLVRLAHRYGAGEAVGGGLQPPVEVVDLSRVFLWPVTAVQELTLTANNLRGARQGLQWMVRGEQGAAEQGLRGGLVNTTLTLYPAEIHTLAVTFDRSAQSRRRQQTA